MCCDVLRCIPLGVNVFLKMRGAASLAGTRFGDPSQPGPSHASVVQHLGGLRDLEDSEDSYRRLFGSFASLVQARVVDLAQTLEAPAGDMREALFECIADDIVLELQAYPLRAIGHTPRKVRNARRVLASVFVTAIINSRRNLCDHPDLAYMHQNCTSLAGQAFEQDRPPPSVLTPAAPVFMAMAVLRTMVDSSSPQHGRKVLQRYLGDGEAYRSILSVCDRVCWMFLPPYLPELEQTARTIYNRWFAEIDALAQEPHTTRTQRNRRRLLAAAAAMLEDVLPSPHALPRYAEVCELACMPVEVLPEWCVGEQMMGAAGCF